MGMSASQARLLYLTAQMNNLSLKGEQVSDAKTRLAMDSQEAQEKYINALNSSRLYLNIDVFTGAGTVTQTQRLTLDNLMAQGYMVSDGSNILGYKQIETPTGEKEPKLVGYKDEDVMVDDTTKPIYEDDGVTIKGYEQKKVGTKKVPQYEEFDVMETTFERDTSFSMSSNELEQGLRSGAYTLVRKSGEESSSTVSIGGVFFETQSLNSCSIITDETDEAAVDMAEAEYNMAMENIQIKDKKYESDQKKIDTEYTACQTEEESIKTVLNKNVDRSFKTFG